LLSGVEEWTKVPAKDQGEIIIETNFSHSSSTGNPNPNFILLTTSKSPGFLLLALVGKKE
jgi:hypothetical protein